LGIVKYNIAQNSDLTYDEDKSTLHFSEQIIIFIILLVHISNIYLLNF